MNKFLKIFLPLFFVCWVFSVFAQAPFSKGVNLTGWFSANNSKSIPFTKFSKKDIENIKSLGCDVIRLPITLHGMTSGAPDYVVDTLFYFYLDQVIDWTEELDMNLIIDNHTIPDATSKAVETPLMKIWPQMATHYKDRSKKVFYEVLNEPNTLAASDWAKIQQKVVDTIRTCDTVHTIIVTGADWGGISGMTALKKLSDPNLLYSFHFYDPFLFTHQGASWASPSMIDLSGVPFPYDAARMPECPASLKGTYIENSLKYSYKTDGTVAKLKSTIDLAVNFATTNNVKIYCGEFGVYNLNSPAADRIEWYKIVPAYLSEKGIPWTMWDYQGGFGLFNKGSDENFEYDINRPLAEGIGFSLPPVKTYEVVADTVPFDIYTDYPGIDIVQNVPSNGTADLFSPDRYEGTFGIYMTELPQYSNIDFDFKYTRDFSKLVAADYKVDFWMKADVASSNVVFRFIDTKTTDAADHPWRMDYTINTALAPFDGNWHHVEIPLKKFRDAGSWDNNAWYNSANKFDWKAVDHFQIVTENMELTGKKFWFDNLRINGDPITAIESRETDIFKMKAFPNPFSGNTTIQYYLPETTPVEVSIFSLSGQKLATLKSGTETQGNHFAEWSGNSKDGISGGIFLCCISSNSKTETIKLMTK